MSCTVLNLPDLGSTATTPRFAFQDRSAAGGLLLVGRMLLCVSGANHLGPASIIRWPFIRKPNPPVLNDIQIIGRKKQLVGKLWNRQEKKRLLAPHGTTTTSLLREEQSKSGLACISHA